MPPECVRLNIIKCDLSKCLNVLVICEKLTGVRKEKRQMNIKYVAHIIVDVSRDERHPIRLGLYEIFFIYTAAVTFASRKMNIIP